MFKRGQVTIFIIIGIVIVLAIVGVLVIRSYVVEQEITEIARPITEELPAELEPVRIYTENCIKTVGEQALIRLGQQGGYIYPDLWNNLEFDEKASADSDGLTFTGSDIKIPYWWYNKEKNDQSSIVFSSNRPTVSQMQADLARYINLELPACLNNYNSFKELNFDITENGFDTTVNIVPGSVRFLVNHPLAIEKENSRAEIENFYVEIPVDLLHMYQIADLITQAQQNYSFLEQHTLNLITLFSGAEENALPPIIEETFNSRSVTWNKNEVHDDLKTILVGYIPYLRFYNSQNYFSYQFPSTDELYETHQRVYNDMVLPLEGAEDLEVRFQYLDDWDLYFNVNAEGETIKPAATSANFFFVDFGWEHYNTVYDVSYPVFISLYSPDSLEGTGYQFNFALETNVRDNKAAETNDFLLPLTSTFQDSLFCNPNQRTSGNITVRVTNRYTHEPVPEAVIYFSAGEEKCQIGTTDQNGLLVSQFPLALGGLITASKESFLTNSELFDTEIGQDDSIALEIWPAKTITASALKKKLVNCKIKGDNPEICYFHNETTEVADNPLEAGLLLANVSSNLEKVSEIRVQGSSKAKRTSWHFLNTPYQPQESEQVLIMLTRISDNEKSYEFAVGLTGQAEETINLYPGEYQLNIQAIWHEGLVIPQDNREIDDEKFTVNELNFEKFFAGGLILENSTIRSTLVIEPADLYSAQKINFLYFYLALPDVPQDQRIAEDINIASELESLSTKFKNQLQPVFT